MCAVPVARFGQSAPYDYPASGSTALASPSHTTQVEWQRLLAAGSVIAGGVLMVTGHKKAGVAVAALGTVVALLDEPEAVETWWKNLPHYLTGAQELLDRVEGYLQEASVQGQRLKSILHR